MSGYYDRKIYDECYNNENILEQIKQSNYYLYPGYAVNNNSCSGNLNMGNTKNLFNQDLNKIGDRSEIESLFKFSHKVEVKNTSYFSIGTSNITGNSLLRLPSTYNVLGVISLKSAALD